jgi:hypothetical protein|tara:strand:+ start:614 stop:835 length:222 start_codon:yes stop_codon:yes gene_type:complete
MNKLKVEGHPDLVRDTKSSAVINNSRRDYEEYMEQYRARKRSNDRIDNMESDMNSIKNELDEIKSLLIKLTNG